MEREGIEGGQAGEEEQKILPRTLVKRWSNAGQTLAELRSQVGCRVGAAGEGGVRGAVVLECPPGAVWEPLVSGKAQDWSNAGQTVVKYGVRGAVALECPAGAMWEPVSEAAQDWSNAGQIVVK